MICHRVNLDGSLSHCAVLNNHLELAHWLEDAYQLHGWATVQVLSEQHGTLVRLTDDGEKYVRCLTVNPEKS